METKRIIKPKLSIEGNNVIGYGIKSTKPLSKQQVEKRVKKIIDKLVGNYQVMVCVNTDFGDRDGREFSSKKRVLLCDDYDWDDTNYFTIYIWQTPEKEGGFDEEHNDCLYDCVFDILGNYKLPKDYKTPETLKEYLGIGRNDLIDIKYIPKIEILYKININLTGDAIFTSSNKFSTRQSVNIILSNKHYYLNEELIINGNLGKSIVKRLYNLVLCDELKDCVNCFDGEDEFKISYDTYRQNKKTVRQTGDAYINKYEKKDRKNGQIIPLQEAYHKLIEDAKILKELTKGKYDLSRAMWKIPELMRGILSKSLKHFDEPDPISIMEQHWIYNTNCNSIIFSSKGEYENAISYDKNSCYPSIMGDNLFTFPIKEGKFIQLSKLPKILQYGIYRAEIVRSGIELNDRWFRFNENNYYTHHHIKSAQVLGLNINLIIDGESNALLYTTNRANGRHSFMTVIQELYNIKKLSSLAKPLLSCMWGMLCSKHTIYRSTVKSPVLLTTEKIVNFRSIGESDDIVVGYLKSSKYYKYDYARIGIFLTSYNCFKMTELLYKYTDNIHKFHTDGFISDKTITLDIGTEIGKWKVDKTGNCKINNSNSVEWLLL